MRAFEVAFQRSALVSLGTAAGVVAIGALVTVQPLAAVGIAAVPSVFWLLATPLRRASTVVFGGLLTLGSPNVTAPKILYLGVMAVVLVIALSRGLSKRSHIPALVTQTVMWTLALVAAGIVNGLVNGHQAIDVVRDSATYAALAPAALVGADAAPWVDRRTTDRMLVGAGMLSTLGFTLEWVVRRGFAHLPMTDVLLHTNVPGVLLWSYSLARLAYGGRRGWLWILPAAAALGLPLLTGTRNVLLYLAAPAAIAAVAVKQRRWRQAARSTIVFPVGLVAVAALAIGIRASAGDALDLHGSLERIASIGTILDEPSSDPSLEARMAQNRVAWESFTSSPLLGAGPGHKFGWDIYRPFDTETRSYTIDTSLAAIAKYGLIGLIVFAALVRSWYYVLPRTPLWSATLAGFAAVIIPASVLGSMIEDKGLPLAMVLAIAARSTYLPNPPVLPTAVTPSAESGRDLMRRGR